MLQNLREQVQRQPSAVPSPARWWVASIGLAVAYGIAYFLAAGLSLYLLPNPDGVAVFWPAAGVSSGVLIALGARCAMAGGRRHHCRDPLGQSHGRSERLERLRLRSV